MQNSPSQRLRVAALTPLELRSRLRWMCRTVRIWLVPVHHLRATPQRLQAPPWTKQQTRRSPHLASTRNSGRQHRCGLLPLLVRDLAASPQLRGSNNARGVSTAVRTTTPLRLTRQRGQCGLDRPSSRRNTRALRQHNSSIAVTSTRATRATVLEWRRMLRHTNRPTRIVVPSHNNVIAAATLSQTMRARLWGRQRGRRVCVRTTHTRRTIKGQLNTTQVPGNAAAACTPHLASCGCDKDNIATVGGLWAVQHQ